MNLAIIDYGSGNLRSAQKAFQHIARRSGLQAEIMLTGSADVVGRADALVLPGVGAFADCMAGLMALDGMMDALRRQVLQGGRPFLGICVGMQLMAQSGLEHGVHDGLDWLPGRVAALQPDVPALKIPHMGWNEIYPTTPHAVLDGLDGQAMYFVHSYAMQPDNPAHCLATCDYGGAFCAVAGRDNMIGTQFHPEKSQQAGLRLIENFLRWRP